MRAGNRIDHYTLVKPLGEGGQGSVWEVVDPRDGGVARALKLVRVEQTGRDGFARARREAKILAAAKHPALVRCHGFFEELGEGVVGVVMDLVSGTTLADALEEGRLDREHAVAALEQIAAALAYIHGAGLAHRDLKPGNVLLADTYWASPRGAGAVKLVDFGIAAPAGNPHPLTTTGAVVGTIPYMAPELIDPATWGKGELPARDVFAFGVLACEVLLRRHPTGLGAKASIVDFARAYKAAQADLIAWPPAGLDGSWQAAVGACLALHPRNRPANGAALCAILRDGQARGSAVSSLGAITTPHQAAVHAVSPAKLETTVPMGSAKPPTTARFSGWVTAVLGFFAAMMIAVAGALIAKGWLQSGEHDEPEPPPSIRLPTAAPSPAPSPSPSLAVRTTTAGLGACCPRELSTCKGPTRFSCPPCSGDRDALPHGASWTLRVEGAKLGSEDLVKARPGAVITMRLGSASRELPLALIPPARAGEKSLLVTTEDVERGRVHITLLDGGVTLADGAAHLDPTKGAEVKASALCAGLRLLVDGPGGATTLSVYLDPVEPTP